MLGGKWIRVVKRQKWGDLLGGQGSVEARNNSGLEQSVIQRRRREGNASGHSVPVIFKLGSRFSLRNTARECDGSNAGEGLSSLIYLTP